GFAGRDAARFAAAEEVCVDGGYGDATEMGGVAELRAGGWRIASGVQSAPRFPEAGTRCDQPRGGRQPANSVRSLFRVDIQHGAIRGTGGTVCLCTWIQHTGG